MKHSWFKTVFPIAAIFSFRMLGLFLLIPVFTLYAGNLHGATPALIGLALGGYGLTQGILQIPFGIFSDKYGRKPIITLGLMLFILGSLVGAVTDTIYGMIFARTLQGTGAIGSVLIALLADLTTDEERTKAMATIGATIGLSFSLAMVISPALTSAFGLSGIFYCTALLAMVGLGLIHLVIPTPQTERFHQDSEAKLSLMNSVLVNKNLQKLNIGIFCQHYILTSTFFCIPLILKQQLLLGMLHKQWHFYLVLMTGSFLCMIPLIILAERKKQIKPVFVGSVLVTCVSQFLLVFGFQSWYLFCLLMFLYFIGFNALEAILPSLISKQAPVNSKGTAMGVYSTSQFLGIFAGGTLSGLLFSVSGNQGVFIGNFGIAFLWLLISSQMQKPKSPA